MTDAGLASRRRSHREVDDITATGAEPLGLVPSQRRGEIVTDTNLPQHTHGERDGVPDRGVELGSQTPEPFVGRPVDPHARALRACANAVTNRSVPTLAAGDLNSGLIS
jgi:hypothetical protein